MAGHPVVPFDQALIDDIAAAMDLRAPNREALEKLAKRFDDAGGEPFEAVAAMATAVGKTYLAAALIEYLARSGIRNFMIVVPRTPVLDKTVNNFTAGHPKSVAGRDGVRPGAVHRRQLQHRSDGRGEATTHEVAPNLWHIRVDGAYADWAFTGWCARWKARRLSR